jgi:hypothetical protein
MTYEQERRRWETINADQALIDQATRRHHAIQSQYSGLQRQEVAFGLAAILDELSPGTYPTSTSVSAADRSGVPPDAPPSGMQPGRDPEGTRSDVG